MLKKKKIKLEKDFLEDIDEFLLDNNKNTNKKKALVELNNLIKNDLDNFSLLNFNK